MYLKHVKLQMTMFSSHISQKCKNMQIFIETELAKRKSKLGAKTQND